MRKVEFIKDFATKKKGEIFKCDGRLASKLVHSDNVAVYADLETEHKIVVPVLEKKKKK